MIKEINSHEELLAEVSSVKKAYLLLHKSGSELSACSMKSIVEAYKEEPDLKVMTADVNKVRDIHKNYNVTTVPGMLYFEDGTFKNIIKGCMSTDYYKSLFGNVLFSVGDDGKPKQPRVVLYSTPTCSWCRTIKAYFGKKNIKFREIDVSKDEKAAADMVRKSGQQGVPQTEIGGQIVVGFDQNKIDRLLGING
jgi:glutaredoxin-like YruB-family protein